MLTAVPRMRPVVCRSGRALRWRVRPSLLAALTASAVAASFGCNRPPDSPPRVTHSVSGTVSGATSSGVALNLTGAWTASTSTDSAGNFRFADLENGSYSVAPLADGYIFTPAGVAVDIQGVDVTNLGFTAVASSAPTHMIAGSISGVVGSEVTIVLGGDNLATTVTESGHFTFKGIADGSYTVTPSDPLHDFDPSFAAVTVSGVDVGGVDFTAVPAANPTYSISGTVSGSVAAGVEITLSGATIAATAAQTNSAGQYSFAGLASGSYSVTPSSTGHLFTPTGAAVTVGAANVTGIDFTATARGAPGALDHSFDGDGVLLDAAGGTGGTFYAVIVQPDGAIVAGGVKVGGGWLVRRFRADGAPDATFNANASPAMPTTGELRGLALDANTGRLVCLGKSTLGSASQLTVVRLNPAGTADNSFANASSRVFNSVDYPNGSSGYAALVLDDSSIVVAGSMRQGTSAYALLERLDAVGGTPVAGFARYLAPGLSEFRSLSQRQGQLVAGGFDNATSPPSTLVVRASTAGLLDAGFGSGGVYSSGNGCRASGVTVTTTAGDLAFAGQDVTGPVFCLAGATSSGTGTWLARDSSAGTSASYTGVAATTDGKAVAAGNGGETYDRYVRVIRFSPGGALDPSFGAAGIVKLEDTAQTHTFWYRLYAVALQSDGRIVVAGNKINTGEINGGAALIRLWP